MEILRELELFLIHKDQTKYIDETCVRGVQGVQDHSI